MGLQINTTVVTLLMTQLLTKAHDALSTVQLRVDVRVTITEQSGLVLVLFLSWRGEGAYSRLTILSNP